MAWKFNPFTGQFDLTAEEAISLTDIDDVTITSVSDLDLLQYDSATSNWVNRDISTILNGTYLKLDGSNANSNIDIGSYDFTTTGIGTFDYIVETTPTLLKLDQTTPQTVINGVPLLNTTPNDSADLKSFVNKEYVDLAVTSLGASYYMYDEDDATGYKTCYLNPSGDAETYIEGAGLSDDDYLGGWISAPGEAPTKLLKGIYDWFLTTEKITGTKDLRVYWTLIERKADTSEVVIATSSNSNIITDKESYLVPLQLTDDYIPDSGSRIIGKLYADVSGGGNAPTIRIYYQGETSSRWEIPANSEIFQNIFVPYSGAVQNVDLGDKDITTTGTLEAGNTTIDVTDTEALLVRKDSDGGDVFTVDTTNRNITVQTGAITKINTAGESDIKANGITVTLPVLTGTFALGANPISGVFAMDRAIYVWDVDEVADPAIYLVGNNTDGSGNHAYGEITFDDNSSRMVFRTDPTVGGDILFSPNGDIVADQNFIIDSDSKKLLFGAGQDASIYYNGSDLIIDPKEVGTGEVNLNGGNLFTTGNILVGDGSETAPSISFANDPDLGFMTDTPGRLKLYSSANNPAMVWTYYTVTFAANDIQMDNHQTDPDADTISVWYSGSYTPFIKMYNNGDSAGNLTLIAPSGVIDCGDENLTTTGTITADKLVGLDNTNGLTIGTTGENNPTYLTLRSSGKTTSICYNGAGDSEMTIGTGGDLEIIFDALTINFGGNELINIGNISFEEDVDIDGTLRVSNIESGDTFILNQTDDSQNIVFQLDGDDIGGYYYDYFGGEDTYWIWKDDTVLLDNKKYIFGSGRDTSIYFNGSDLIINSENITANDEVHFTNFDKVTCDTTIEAEQLTSTDDIDCAGKFTNTMASDDYSGLFINQAGYTGSTLGSYGNPITPAKFYFDCDTATSNSVYLSGFRFDLEKATAFSGYVFSGAHEIIGLDFDLESSSAHAVTGTDYGYSDSVVGAKYNVTHSGSVGGTVAPNSPITDYGNFINLTVTTDWNCGGGGGGSVVHRAEGLRITVDNAATEDGSTLTKNTYGINLNTIRTRNATTGTSKVYGIYLGTGADNATDGELWFLYNDSSASDVGNTAHNFLGKDDVKNYRGTGKDVSDYFDGSNWIFNSENITANDEIHFTNFSKYTFDNGVQAADYYSGDGTQGITQSETGVTDFDIVIKDGLIVSFTKNN
ncbi:MAG: hypothetical protein ACTSUF_10270 [Candidatus Heimdallarchaeaceae archaeon]